MLNELPPPLPIRTLLFVPGSRPERFAKAIASGADAVILDLEDAVSATDKVMARDAVCAWLKASAPDEHPEHAVPERVGPFVIVRINARDTPFYHDDLAALQNLRTLGVHGLMLPKCDQASDLLALPDVGYWPMIESARGLANAEAIGSVPGVQRLVFGSFDFQVDLGLDADASETELAPYRAQLVLSSRLAGLAAPVDGVTAAWNDDAALTQAVQRALRQGFGAKLCIHPRQIPVVHAAMQPSEAELLHARRVLEVALAVNGAAVALDGSMIDRPIILRAQAVLGRNRSS